MLKQFTTAACAAGLTAMTLTALNDTGDATYIQPTAIDTAQARIIPINPPLPAGFAAALFILGGPFSPYQQRVLNPDYKETDEEVADEREASLPEALTTKNNNKTKTDLTV